MVFTAVVKSLPVDLYGALDRMGMLAAGKLAACDDYTDEDYTEWAAELSKGLKD